MTSSIDICRRLKNPRRSDGAQRRGCQRFFEERLMKIILSLIAVAAVLSGTPAQAHHSFAMFDMQNQLSLTGTVREFQFNNPHCFIQLVVAGDQPVEWSVEMGAPAHLIRQGWNAGTLKPGDKITVVINPLHDGGSGGNYVSAVNAEGKVVGAKP